MYYCKSSKNSDAFYHYHNCLKDETVCFYNADGVANDGDPDQNAPSGAF